MHDATTNRRWVPGLILAACLGAGGAAVAAEEAATTENLLFLPQEARREAFARIDALAPTRPIRAGDAPLQLRPADASLPPIRYDLDGETHTLQDFLARPSTVGLVVVQGDRILFEHYAPGHDEATPWVSFSVSKSVTSMLIGAAVHDGYIASLDEPVSSYLPRLRGTDYEDVSIEQVLHMSSGVAWNEDYADPASDVAQAGASNGLELVAYLGGLSRAHAPGAAFNYNTGETNLVGEILRAAIGNNASTFLEYKIWQPFGMEHDAHWLLGAPGGGETGGCCISATLRDYARIGLFALADGVHGDGTRVLPEGWMAASTTPSPAAPFYGYQWWLGEDERFAALGIFGQRIAVDPETGVVIAVHGNAPAASGSAYHAHLNAVTEAIQEALR
jgi:CubicO group peptidase (beta-lactamase class C family)